MNIYKPPVSKNPEVLSLMVQIQELRALSRCSIDTGIHRINEEKIAGMQSRITSILMSEKTTPVNPLEPPPFNHSNVVQLKPFVPIKKRHLTLVSSK